MAIVGFMRMSRNCMTMAPHIIANLRYWRRRWCSGSAKTLQNVSFRRVM